MRLSCEFRAPNKGCIGNSDVSEEAVAATTDSFDEAGTLGGVAEGLADFVDCLVEPVVEIHERVSGPEFLLKFLATDDLAGVLEQRHQDLEGLLLEPDSDAALAQFASTNIHLENPETEPPVNLRVCFHAPVNLRRSVPHVNRTVGRGQRSVSLLWSVGYQGTDVPAERDRPSIAWIVSANQSDGIHPAPVGGMRRMECRRK